MNCHSSFDRQTENTYLYERFKISMANFETKLDAILGKLAAQKDELRQEIQDQVGQQLGSQLSDIREDLQRERLVVSTEVKKLRVEAEYKWSKQGNKVQFVFNSDIDDQIKQALWAVEHNKPDYAREVLSDTQAKINQRNKLIKVADSSEGGWDTANQYQANPIADDSDDESKLQKAESRAIRKRKNKQMEQDKVKKQKLSGGFNNASHFISPSVSGWGHAATPMWGQGTTMPFGGAAGFGGPSGSLQSGAPNLFRGQGAAGKGSCFGCGSFSHWRRDCPLSRQQTTSNYGQRKQ